MQLPLLTWLAFCAIGGERRRARRCHAAFEADQINPPPLPLGTHRWLQYVFAKQLYNSSICMNLIYNTQGQRGGGMVSERLDVFYMAVGCEWATRSECVCGSCGACSRTGPVHRLFTHRLSIPELGSTRSPLIFTSHLPSNTEDVRVVVGGGAWWVIITK